MRTGPLWRDNLEIPLIPPDTPPIIPLVRWDLFVPALHLEQGSCGRVNPHQDPHVPLLETAERAHRLFAPGTRQGA